MHELLVPDKKVPDIHVSMCIDRVDKKMSPGWDDACKNSERDKDQTDDTS
jgi:hypothetical protein